MVSPTSGQLKSIFQKKTDTNRDGNKMKKNSKSLIQSIEEHMKIEQITVHLKSMDQLYCEFDSGPLENRIIRKEVDQYITDQFEDVPITSLCNIKVSIDDFDTSCTMKVKKSLENYYAKKRYQIFTEIRKETAYWIRKLIFGTGILAVCLAAGIIFNRPYFDSFPFAKVIGESLGIVGWVAIWEPAEFFLYDRRKNSKKLATAIRLEHCDFEIESGK